MDIEVRRAVPQECADIGEVAVAASAAAGPLRDDYAAKLRDAAYRYDAGELLVACDVDGRVLGSATVCPPGSPLAEISVGDDELELRMLAVDPSAQGRGVGDALMREVMANAQQRGFRRVVLCTPNRAQPSPAYRLYRRLGFDRMPSRDWSPIPEVQLLAMSWSTS